MDKKGVEVFIDLIPLFLNPKRLDDCLNGINNHSKTLSHGRSAIVLRAEIKV